MSLFLLQGIGFGIFDSGGNQIMLRLWNDISTSPLNAMHAGYGIGAMISIQLLKNFIKFNPNRVQQSPSSSSSSSSISFQNTTINSTSNLITSNDIELYIPYSISASIGFVIFICFIIAQLFEIKNMKKIEIKNKKSQEWSIIKVTADLNDEETSENETPKIDSTPLPSLQKILFNNKKLFKTKQLAVILFELFLLNFLLFNIASYLAVSSMFMLTYLSKGKI